MSETPEEPQPEEPQPEAPQPEPEVPYTPDEPPRVDDEDKDPEDDTPVVPDAGCDMPCPVCGGHMIKAIGDPCTGTPPTSEPDPDDVEVP